jgi:hypothetical protein
MSNALAIATVTTALAQIVRTAAQAAVNGADVATGRPDPATNPSHRVHLFLYQVSPNAALRNADLPTRSHEAKVLQRPQVALDLHYLLAFYGDENELEPQRMLGAVVRDLHAKPLLTRQMITDATASQPFLTDSNLVDAVEQVKLSPDSLSLDELSKLWSVFLQTPYALSVMYRATVVLIESEETAALALPVLKRGKDDRGVDTFLGPFPTLDGMFIGEPDSVDLRPRPPSYRSAQFGLAVVLKGSTLGGDTMLVRFRHPRLPQPESVAASVGTSGEVRIDLPTLDDPDATKDKWAAGWYAVEAAITKGDVEHTTNSLPLPLAPRIIKITPTWPNPVVIGPNGNATVTIACSPKVLPAQTAVMLLAGREVVAESHPVTSDTLTFVIKNAPTIQDEFVRLRVDGVDSVPFKSAGVPPQLGFDDGQRVTIT